MPEYNLAGKRVIVTGAARGLGRPGKYTNDS